MVSKHIQTYLKVIQDKKYNKEIRLKKSRTVVYVFVDMPQ